MLQITLLNNHAIYVNFWQFSYYNSCLVVLENFKPIECRRCCMYKIKHYDWNIWKEYPFTFMWWDLKGNWRVCVPTFYLPRYSNFCTLVKKNWNYVWTKEDNCVESLPFCRNLAGFLQCLLWSHCPYCLIICDQDQLLEDSVFQDSFILFYFILYFVGWIILLRNSLSVSCQWQKTAWHSVQQFLSLKPTATCLV